MTVNMTVKLFATLKDRAGASQVTVDTPDQLSVRELRETIGQQHPGLAALTARSVVSVNHEFAFNDDIVRASDEVALFPPVSGGM
jgi:molybdopterin synthase catalytic subunit